MTDLNQGFVVVVFLWLCLYIWTNYCAILLIIHTLKICTLKTVHDDYYYFFLTSSSSSCCVDTKKRNSLWQQELKSMPSKENKTCIYLFISHLIIAWCNAAVYRVETFAGLDSNNTEAHPMHKIRYHIMCYQAKPIWHLLRYCISLTFPSSEFIFKVHSRNVLTKAKLIVVGQSFFMRFSQCNTHNWLLFSGWFWNILRQEKVIFGCVSLISPLVLMQFIFYFGRQNNQLQSVSGQVFHFVVL